MDSKWFLINFQITSRRLMSLYAILIGSLAYFTTTLIFTVSRTVSEVDDIAINLNSILAVSKSLSVAFLILFTWHEWHCFNQSLRSS